MDNLINKIHFANCIDILNQLPDQSVNLFLQDPPFEVTNQVWDKGFVKMLPDYWNIWIKKGVDNCCFVFKASFPFAIDLINSNRKYFKYEWVWKKNRYTNFVNAKKMPMRCIEYLFVFYKSQPTYNPVLRLNITQGKTTTKSNKSTKIYNIKDKTDKPYIKYVGEFGQPVNLIDIGGERASFDSTKEQDRHANRTNPELWKYFIQTYSNENDLVFDGFTGSGSVAEACINLNRNFITCENNEFEFNRAKINIQNAFDLKNYGYDKTALTTKQGNLFSGLNI
jgi:site-specific DNA-methyltransferase (adenine-specific)